MNVMVVYDSMFGNTEKVAYSIAQAVGGSTLRAAELIPAHWNALNLLIIGSPTHGGFPTPGIDALLRASASLSGVKAAAFDTRTRTTIFGYAAPKIARKLQKAGAQVVAPPEGFFVRGMRGPLLDSDLERSAQWARRIISSDNNGHMPGQERAA
jgi:flavodoxin I